MSITIEAGSAFDKEALTKILECCSEQTQTFQYVINQPCSCLRSPPANDAVVPSHCLCALRCAEMAFRLWDEGLRDTMLVLHLTSHRVVNDVFQIEDVAPRTEEVSAKGALTFADLEEMIITEGELQSVETLLPLCFPTPSLTLAAAILQYGQESVVYLKIPFENSLIHAVFDPHLRSDHPSPSFSISRKSIDIHSRKILVSDNDASAYRIQRISRRVIGETFIATKKSVHRVSNERLDFNEDALKPASSRTSWPHLVHGDDTLQDDALEAAAVSIQKCDPRADNPPTSFPENETADPIEQRRFSDIDSQNKFSVNFVADRFQNSRDNIHEEWLDRPTTPPTPPRSCRPTLQANVITSSPDWSNQSPSPSSDDGDIFRPFQPPWTLLPPSPPFLQSYSSSSRSIANFSIEDNYPFSVDNTFCLPSFSDPGSERSPYVGPTTSYWSRSPLSNVQRDDSSKEPCTDGHDVSSLQRQTNGHFPHSTIPRNKQKQKRNDLLYSSHFTTCPFPGVSGKAPNEEFSPYTSAENLNPTRPCSSPESDGGGPSRLGSLDSQWRRNSRLEREEGTSCQAHSVDHRDIVTHQCMSEEDWEIALLRQLQEEEEIAASVAHQISIDAAWIVKLQQFLEEQKVSHGSPSSRSTSLDLDRQLALQLQQEEANVTSRTDYSRATRENTPDRSNSPAPIDNFECGICHEKYGNGVKISVADCGHSYCRECIGFLARAKIEDNRYPILCPDCLIDRSRAVKCQLSLEILQGLDLSSRELERLEELQTLSHSVVLECPKCNERISINRPEYGARKFIICQRRECGHKWCRDCLKPIRCLDDRHRCKNENIERLMRRRGWKYCPGCRTPVQKESGCNHMTCSAPGCNAHFCYRCGVLIVDTTNGGDVGLTVTEHYANSNCRLFERRYCTIQ